MLRPTLPPRRASPAARIAASLSVLLCAMLFACLALGQEKLKPIVVYIEGPDASEVRDAIIQVLPSHVDVIDASEFKDALKKAGQARDIGNAITVERQRKRFLPKIQEAAGEVGAEAVIVGRVRRTKGGEREVWLLYVDDTEELEVDEAVPLPKDREERRTGLKNVVGPPLEKLAPEEPEPEDDAKAEDEAGDGEEEEEEEDASPRAKHDPAESLFALGVHLELGGRFFDYSDPITQNLRPYDVFGAPNLHLGGEVYPLAGSGIRFAKDLGVHIAYGRAFLLQSAIEGGEPIDTSWERFSLGLKGRIGVGDSGILVYPSGSLALQSFTFDAPPADLAPTIPSVRYSALRLGVEARVPVGGFALIPGLGYHFVLSGGQGPEEEGGADVEKRFTDPSVGGLDLGIAAGFDLAEGLELRLGVEYARYFYSFSPVPGDAYVAGGALDQFVFLRAGAVYTY